MPAEKVTPGQRIASSPLREAQTVNDLLDLLHRHKSGQLSGLGRTDQPPPLGTDFVMVRNDSGADRERGDVLQLGAYLLTTSDETDNHWNRWYEGNTPSGDPVLKFVILHEATKQDEIRPAHSTGTCAAKVNVIDDGHTHAKPVSASYVLESSNSGPIELLSIPVGTGEQVLDVRFLPSFADHRIVRIDGGHTTSDEFVTGYPWPESPATPQGYIFTGQVLTWDEDAQEFTEGDACYVLCLNYNAVLRMQQDHIALFAGLFDRVVGVGDRVPTYAINCEHQFELGRTAEVIAPDAQGTVEIITWSGAETAITVEARHGLAHGGAATAPLRQEIPNNTLVYLWRTRDEWYALAPCDLDAIEDRLDTLEAGHADHESRIAALEA